LFFSSYENLGHVMEDHGCGGVITVVPCEEHKDAVRAIAESSTPMVVVGSQWPDMDVPTVDSDVAEGTRRAVNYMVSKGHTRIGYVTPKADSVFNVGLGLHSIIREGVFRSRMQELGLNVCEDWVFRLDYGVLFDSDREHLRRIFLKGQGPSALIISIHGSTLPLLAELKSMGLCIPQDLSIICWDDPSWAAYTDPPLTVIRQPLGEIGPRAVAKLLAQMDGRGVFARKEILPVEIVERASVTDLREDTGRHQIYQANRG
jgi:DNA-binding LacI/PurR family transcriptional regulator